MTISTFYLGTHKPHWLWTESCRDLFPLFVSYLQLRKYKKLYPAVGRWSLDGGGFTIISSEGSYDSLPSDIYIKDARRFRDEIGNLDFLSPQDWMCEPFILKRTGKTLEEHQRLTVSSYIELSNKAPDLPFIPVLQGWHKEDYLNCIDLYYKARIYLHEYPVVGVGSICRRQGTQEATNILRSIWMQGIKIHAFGFKINGLRQVKDFISSSDSMAWSFHGRKRQPLEGHTTHKNCANCSEYARHWRDTLLMPAIS